VLIALFFLLPVLLCFVARVVLPLPTTVSFAAFFLVVAILLVTIVFTALLIAIVISSGFVLVIVIVALSVIFCFLLMLMLLVLLCDPLCVLREDPIAVFVWDVDPRLLIVFMLS
jgi:hypothetical protein